MLNNFIRIDILKFVNYDGNRIKFGKSFGRLCKEAN